MNELVKSLQLHK